MRCKTPKPETVEEQRPIQKNLKQVPWSLVLLNVPDLILQIQRKANNAFKLRPALAGSLRFARTQDGPWSEKLSPKHKITEYLGSRAAILR